MSQRLLNKVALVTGAGSGLGEATIKRMAEEGATVVVTDIDQEAAQRVAMAIGASGGKAQAVFQDVTDEDGWDSLLVDIQQRHGQLDILVNNAGVVFPNNVEECTLEEWRKTQSVNLEAVFLGCRAAIKTMGNRGGSIINISSIEGIIGDPGAAAYNASKGGVRIFTKSCALHCAREGYPIRVNSVHPGYIMTPLVANAIDGLTEEEKEEMLTRVIGEIPMGEMGQPEDIANGCLFLASDESRYMTGSELVIDGGYTCH